MWSMRAYVYPECIDFLSWLPDGKLACADFLTDPATRPALLISFTIVLEEGGVFEAIPYLGYYSPEHDIFAFLLRVNCTQGVLYDCGKYTIDFFWPNKPANPTLHDLYLNFVAGHGQDPVDSCAPLTLEQAQELSKFFDKHFSLSAEYPLCPRPWRWSKE